MIFLKIRRFPSVHAFFYSILFPSFSIRSFILFFLFLLVFISYFKMFEFSRFYNKIPIESYTIMPCLLALFPYLTNQFTKNFKVYYYVLLFIYKSQNCKQNKRVEERGYYYKNPQIIIQIWFIYPWHSWFYVYYAVCAYPLIKFWIKKFM